MTVAGLPPPKDGAIPYSANVIAIMAAWSICCALRDMPSSARSGTQGRRGILALSSSWSRHKWVSGRTASTYWEGWLMSCRPTAVAWACRISGTWLRSRSSTMMCRSGRAVTPLKQGTPLITASGFCCCDEDQVKGRHSNTCAGLFVLGIPSCD